MKNSLLKDLNVITIKEVASTLRVSEKHIRMTIKKIFPNLMKNGVTTYLNEGHVTAIKLQIEKNPHLDQSVEVKTNLEKKLIIQQAMGYLNEEVETLRAENSILIKDKLLNAPKVALAEECIRDNYTHYSIRNAGKQLGLKQKDIFDLMRSKRLLTLDNLPTQHAINKGYLTLRTNIVEGKNRPQSVMTMENIYNFKKSYEKDFING